MNTAASMVYGEARGESLHRGALVALWILSGVLLLAAIGSPPITRTQEARVLETARQMLGTGWHGWLIPQLNGEPRLQKPPLAYWLAATAFTIGGVSEGVGRVPTALAAWLTLWLVFRFTCEAFNQRVALASAAALLGSLMFFRFTRQAETDALAMLFLTLAIYALWRSRADSRAIWMHTAAAATGLVVLSKGPPALFVVVFMLALCWIESRWDIVKRFVLGGALLTLVVIAAPWFLYVRLHQDTSIWMSELKTAGSGEDHFGWPWVYIPGMAIGAVPWTAPLPLALFNAARRWRSEPGVRFTAIWFLAILVPLCINGNKQNHYLVSLTPAMMILVAQLIVDWPSYLDTYVRWVFCGMVVAAFGVTALVPVAGRVARGHYIAADWVVMATLAIASIMVVTVARRRSIQAGMAALLAVVCAVMPLMVGLWEPTLKPRNVRNVAHDIRDEFGDGPYVFYGSEVSLSLCFELRSVIPLVRNDAGLVRWTLPGTVVLVPVKHDRQAPHPPPPPFAWRKRVESVDQTVDL